MTNAWSLNKRDLCFIWKYKYYRRNTIFSISYILASYISTYLIRVFRTQISWLLTQFSNKSESSQHLQHIPRPKRLKFGRIRVSGNTSRKRASRRAYFAHELFLKRWRTLFNFNIVQRISNVHTHRNANYNLAKESILVSNDGSDQI